MRTCHTLSQAQRAQGLLGAALETCQEALGLASEAGGPPLPAAGVARADLAEISCEQNELDTALHHATEAVTLRRRLGTAQWLATSLATRARVRQARGDEAGAVEAIEEAERVGSGLEEYHLFNPVPVGKARLLLLGGEIAEATRWAAERDLGLEDEVTYLREPEHLILARVLIGESAPEQALRLIERLLADAKAAERAGSVMEILALQALALWAGDERERALRTLWREP